MANGCAAASCHGPNTTSRFQLVRPAVNRPIQNATTQSNLRAVLAQVDTEKPEDSPLLTVPLAPHGTSRRAIFGKPQQQQYQLLLAWVRDVAGKTEKASSSAPSVPDSSDPFGTGKPGDVPPTGQPRQASNGPPPTANIVDRLHERLQQGQPPHSSPSSQAPTAAGRSPKRHSAPEPFRPRDPFDAELFNRRFFPTAAAKKEAESPGPRPAEEVRAVPVGSGR